ncbi:MAG TPA: DUF92 domain-containing protein [bacterium]|nr:DUF92 domain-containing protein [bacterium]
MSEILRQGAHIGVGVFALLFAVLPAWACLVMAGIALVHNTFVLPRYARILWRNQDHRRGYSPGVIAYSVTLILLCVFFWNRPDIGAFGWGVLAFGDGFATIAGRTIRGPRLPWNPAKSWVGFVTFALASTGAGYFLASLVRAHAAVLGDLPSGNLLTACIAGGILGAIIESLPSSLDDNISAPLAAAAMFALVDSWDAASWSHAQTAVQASALPMLGLSLFLGTIAWQTKTVTWSGFVGGVALTFVVAACGGPHLFAGLLAFWITAQGATRIGWKFKSGHGIAQSRSGRREASHAFAKLGIPALLAVVGRASPDPRPYDLAALSALGAAACDTVATEIGQLSKKRPRRLPRLRPVPPGTPGGMTLLGWAAGILAAVLVFIVASFFGGPGFGLLSLILSAAVMACLVESFLGALLIPRGLMGKGMLNLVLSATAAWLAWTLAASAPMG